MTDIEKKKEEHILGQEVSESEMEAVSGGGKQDYCPLAPYAPSCKNNSMRSMVDDTESTSRNCALEPTVPGCKRSDLF